MSASKLWLVKVPKHLLESWQRQGPGATLGSIFPADGAAPGFEKRAYMLRLAADGAGAPREYALALGDPVGAMYSFVPGWADTPAGEMRLEGKIERKGELTATELTSNYKQLVRERQETAAARPELQVLPPEEEQQLGVATQKLQKQGELRKQEDEKKRRKEDRAAVRAEEQKRQKRLTREELRDLVFEKFETRQFWHKADLAKELCQKSNDLGPILDEVCERERFGEHKQEYKLKLEFGGRSG